jgi:hypothetical protein
MSGIDNFAPDQQEIFKVAREERLRDLHAPLMDEISQREAVEAEVAMVVNVVRNDLAHDSGLETLFEIRLCDAVPVASGAGLSSAARARLAGVMFFMFATLNLWPAVATHQT